MNEQIKQENRKALPKFLGVIVGALLLGILLGGAVQMIQSHGVDEFTAAFRRGMEACAVWVIPVVLLVVNFPSGLTIHKCERKLREWDKEDEVLPDQIERRFNYVLLFTTLSYLISMLVLSLVMVGMENMPVLLVVLGEFIVALVVLILQQKKCVDVLKTMNPEKQGSVLEINFQKKWLESCDEAERKRVGEASYAAYKAVNVTCIVLWVLLIFVDQIFDVGAVPFVLLVTILCVSIIVYCTAEIRAARRRSQVR